MPTKTETSISSSNSGYNNTGILAKALKCNNFLLISDDEEENTDNSSMGKLLEKFAENNAQLYQVFSSSVTQSTTDNIKLVLFHILLTIYDIFNLEFINTII